MRQVYSESVYIAIMLMFAIAVWFTPADAARVEFPQNAKVWIDVETGKQITPDVVYRNPDKTYLECKKVEVVYNGNTGKPSTKPVK